MALHVAAANGKLLAVSYLLSICADPNVKDRWGGTPLEDALRGEHMHCAKLIQAFGGELGTNPSAEIAQRYETLNDISVKDAQEHVSQALAKVTPRLLR
jgi:ankyrin repeat protein